MQVGGLPQGPLICSQCRPQVGRRVIGAASSRNEIRRPLEADGKGGWMSGHVLDLREIDQTQVAVVGGKGARLGELGRIDGVRVPDGFCVTTDAFGQILAQAPRIDEGLDRLALLNPADREAIRTASAGIRQALEAVEIPGGLSAAVTGAVAGLGEHAACAVRSSATAEDSPTASFAGQQDTYLK